MSVSLAVNNLNVGIACSIVVERTKRKRTVAIEVLDNTVRVIVPKHLSDDQVQAIIDKRSGWIQRQLQFHAAQEPVLPKSYTNGEIFTYLGRQYRIKILPQSQAIKAEVKLKCGCLQIAVPADICADKLSSLVRLALVQWYEQRAFQYLCKKTEKYGLLLGVKANSIKVADYKSRWGSCSSKATITYSWRIIIAPPEIVDYLVVHELCHILRHDHSPRYWRYVEFILPDYYERRMWLKKHGRYLVI